MQTYINQKFRSLFSFLRTVPREPCYAIAISIFCAVDPLGLLRWVLINVGLEKVAALWPSYWLTMDHVIGRFYHTFLFYCMWWLLFTAYLSWLTGMIVIFILYWIHSLFAVMRPEWFTNIVVRSRWLEWFSVVNPRPTRTVVELFGSIDFGTLPDDDTRFQTFLAHAQVSCETVATMFGKKLFVIGRNVVGGIKGMRLLHTTGDLSKTVVYDKVTNDHIIAIMDCDYHIDMCDVLRWNRPIMVCTFIPPSAGAIVGSDSFSIVDDKVRLNMNGNGEHVIQLWDYNHPVITHHHDYWFFGLSEALAYEVYSYPLPALGYKMVYLNPVRRAFGPKVIIDTMPRCQLARWQLSNQGLNAVAVAKKGEVGYSISTRGASCSDYVDEQTYISVLNRWELNGCKMSPGDVQRLLPEKDQSLASSLVRHNKAFSSAAVVDLPVVVTGSAKHYTVISPIIEEGKTYARTFATCPLANEAVFPTECYSNDKACVQGRIEAPRNAKIPSQEYVEYAKEFVALVVPDGGKGIPLDLQEVVDLQNGPTQRARAKAEYNFLDLWRKVFVDAFQKREAYPEGKDPRNISKLPTHHTINLSSFTLAFSKDIMKYLDWYMPCRSPKDITAALRVYASLAKELIETDFSRFDGSISEWLRIHIELAVLLAWVEPKYRAELRQMIMDEIAATGETVFGVVYRLLGGRASGSALTSVGNSLINAFTSYCAHRISGLSPSESFKRIGLIYGDDNVSDCWPHDIIHVCRDLGLLIKVKRVAKGEPLGYLGRIFIDAWTTDTSFQDIRRSLSKIHTTVSPKLVPLCVAAHAKVSGYLPNDEFTPILGRWCQVLQLLYAHDYVLTEEILDALSKDLPFCSRQSNCWPQDPADIPLMLDIVAGDLGIDSADIQQYETDLLLIGYYYSGSNDREGALKKLAALQPFGGDVFVKIDSKLDIIIEGELYLAEQDPSWAMLSALYDAYQSDFLFHDEQYKDDGEDIFIYKLKPGWHNL